MPVRLTTRPRRHARAHRHPRRHVLRREPAPFYRLCQELWPGRYAPTPTHRFIRLLEQKQLLVRCYTQNIDSLESAAGLPTEKVDLASSSSTACDSSMCMRFVHSMCTACTLPDVSCTEQVVAAHGNFDTASVVTGPSRGEPAPRPDPEPSPAPEP